MPCSPAGAGGGGRPYPVFCTLYPVGWLLYVLAPVYCALYGDPARPLPGAASSFSVFCGHRLGCAAGRALDVTTYFLC